MTKAEFVKHLNEVYRRIEEAESAADNLRDDLAKLVRYMDNNIPSESEDLDIEDDKEGDE